MSSRKASLPTKISWLRDHRIRSRR